MTRKDYIMITRATARAHYQSVGIHEGAGVRIVIRCLVDALKADNPKFDEEKFVKEVWTVHPKRKVG